VFHGKLQVRVSIKKEGNGASPKSQLMVSVFLGIAFPLLKFRK